MKKLFLASVAVIAVTGASFAEATLELKGTNSNGSTIGVQSSQATGNGDWVSGNGTGGFGGGDQTSYAGERGDLVQTDLAKEGRGNSNAAGGCPGCER